jgi:hypothetical protein
MVEERLQIRLSSRKGKLLSLGGILVLINAVLRNMVLYMISFLQLSRGVLKRFDYFLSRFFWQGDSEKRKYQLAKWRCFAAPRIMEDSEYIISRSRIGSYSLNGYLSFSPRMEYGKHS